MSLEISKKINIPYPKSENKNNAFWPCTDEIRLSIARFLPERALRSLACVSRRFFHVATDRSLWKSIAASWTIKIPKGTSPYLHMTEFRLGSINIEPNISTLVSPELLWYNDTNLLFRCSANEEEIKLGVSDYSLNIAHQFSLPTMKTGKFNRDFMFLVYPENNPDIPQTLKKGIHAYQSPTDNLVSTFAADADTIHAFDVEGDTIAVIKVKNGKTYGQLWVIKREEKKPIKFVSLFETELSIGEPISSVEIFNHDYLLLKTTTNEQHCFYINKKKQRLTPQKTDLLTLSKAIKSDVLIEGHEIITAMPLPDYNRFLIIARSIKHTKKLRVIICSREFSLKLPHFSRIFVKAFGSLLLIVSDKGTVYRIDLDAPVEKTVRKLWKMKTFGNLYYVEYVDIVGHHLILRGKKVPWDFHFRLTEAEVINLFHIPYTTVIKFIGQY